MSFKLNDYTMAKQLKWRSIHLADHLALCYLADGETETERLTYRELDIAAIKIAAKLQSLNLKNKHVLMLYSSGLEFVKAFFGCLYAGAIAVPTYVPKSPQILQKIEGIQQDCNARIILTTQDLLDEGYLNTSKLSELLILATDKISHRDQSEVYYELFTMPEDIVFIQYTSGSTSEPKGAMVSNTNIMVNQVMLQHVFELDETSVGVTWLPLFHDMGLIASLLNAIYVGYPIYIMPPSAFIRNPLRWLQCISKYKGTYTCAPNFAYDLCIKNISPEACTELDLSSLKKAINAAEPVQPTTLQEFTKHFSPYGFHEEAFTPAYGLAEATVFVAGKSDSVLKYVYLESDALKNNKIIYSESPKNTSKLVSCGTANYLGQKIKIINPDTLEETNDIGEICIAGKHIVKGYLNKPEISKSVFEMQIDGINYLRTGDLGFIDKAGDIYITGRIKDLIIINGSNYYPQDIELAAESKIPLIRNNSIASFSVDINHKEQLIIVIELNRKMLADLAPKKLGSEINSFVFHATALAAYEIIFIAPGTLPKTTSGKIQRQTCKKMYLENDLKITAKWQIYNPSPSPEVIKANSTSASEWINKIEIINCITIFFAKTLKIKVEDIAAESKFSDFNIDSIQMAALSVELEKIIKLPIPEKIFYDCATIQDMADFLVSLSTQSKEKSVTPLQPPQQKSGRKIAIPKFAEKLHRKIN